MTNLIFPRSKLGLLLSAGYGLCVSLVLVIHFSAPDNKFSFLTLVLMTLPGSIAVVFLGFLLIHLSSYGMEYGFVLCAVANCLVLYFIGAALSSYWHHRPGPTTKLT